MFVHPPEKSLVLVTPPASEPIALATAKLHCRVDSDDTLDDDLIGGYISAAREQVELRTRRALVPRSYQLRLDGFPTARVAALAPGWSLERFPGRFGGLIRLPCPPLISVDSIAYTDQAGNPQVLDPSAYHVEAGGRRAGTVSPAYGTAFPVARCMPGSVQVGFTAGYAPPAVVPPSACHAMLLLVGAWYRSREAITPGAMMPLPYGVESLLAAVQWGSYA